MSDSLLSDLNPLRIVSRIADGISDTVTDMRGAIAGDHLVIGLTGLSGNGKTTFLTSLAHFLTNDWRSLVGFPPVREGRFLGAVRCEQTDSDMPAFRLDEAEGALFGTPPRWPAPTKDISELTLELRSRAEKSLFSFSDTRSLRVDFIDYPGEWLMDLPLLSESYREWSEGYLALIRSDPRLSSTAEPWLSRARLLEAGAEADRQAVRQLVSDFTKWLLMLKNELGCSHIQPGRFIMPGEFHDSPLLEFVPWAGDMPSDPSDLPESSFWKVMEHHYSGYVSKVVSRFYEKCFSRIDRQVVLVDCLKALEEGPACYRDIGTSLDSITRNFSYGAGSFLMRLFSRRIDRVLFAAAKCDTVPPDQHGSLRTLLRNTVEKASDGVSYSAPSVETQYLTISSAQCTRLGVLGSGKSERQVLCGTENGKAFHLSGIVVPESLPDGEEYAEWKDSFRFLRPDLPEEGGIRQIRIDQALGFLLDGFL